MSIASEITRLGSLRDTIRSKLISAGIISNTSAKLSECATAIDGMAVNSKVSKVLDTSTTSVAIPKGYHKEAGTVSISVQEKTQNITSGTATVSPDSGKVLKKVTVNGPTSYAGTTQVASGVTQDDDNTYFAVPKSGYYDTNSKIAAKNSNLSNQFDYYEFNAKDGYTLDLGKKPTMLIWTHSNTESGSATRYNFYWSNPDFGLTNCYFFTQGYDSSSHGCVQFGSGTTYVLKSISDDGVLTFNKFPNYPYVKLWVAF